MSSRLAAACCALALALAAASCGPGEEDDPVGAAHDTWEIVRKRVADLGAASGEAGRKEPRKSVCYRLSTELREALRRRAGGPGLPDCEFLDGVALLNGDTRLGPLRAPVSREGVRPLTVTATLAAVRGAERRSVDVELVEANPGNWEIERLDGMP